MRGAERAPTEGDMRDNREVFRTVERAVWAHKRDLLPAEQVLIEDHLEKDRTTVEAGTAGGRILREMHSLGFTSLHGFDFVPELIEDAKANDRSGTIRFDVQDATRLTYPDASFQQAVYLQQLLSIIESESGRCAVAREAYRILEPDGRALFSVLCFDGRKTTKLRHAVYRPHLAYLRVLRRARGSHLSVQHQPWPTFDGKFNPGSLTDRGPYMYWFRASEIEELLRSVGFEICAVGSDSHICDRRMAATTAKLNGALEGAFYLVCRKGTSADRH